MENWPSSLADISHFDVTDKHGAQNYNEHEYNVKSVSVQECLPTSR